MREPSRFLCFFIKRENHSPLLLSITGMKVAFSFSAACRNRFCGSVLETLFRLLCNIYQIFAVIFGKNLEVIAVEFGIERRVTEEIMVAVFGSVLFRHL